VTATLTVLIVAAIFAVTLGAVLVTDHFDL
jgi:hypothetical protein